jgi:DNA (cytosine-5)-methyltransferase 1
MSQSNDSAQPILLDLFCGVGGCTKGYQRAGFYVVGVDINPQPNYCGDEFVQADALTFPLTGFDGVHASPPCQAYTQLGNDTHPRLIEPVRDRLQATGCPYVIENVVGAPLEPSVILCGSMFGLNVRRHRLFECSFPVMTQPCWHGSQDEIRAYYGKKGWLVWTPAAANVQKRGRKPLLRGSVEQAEADMGIDWARTWDELREAVPPAYTEHIGQYLLADVRLRQGAAA